MQQHGSEQPTSVALYWDFENLHASLCEARQEGAYSKQDNRFRVQEPLIDIQAVVELAALSGRLPSTAPTATGSISAAIGMRCSNARSS